MRPINKQKARPLYVLKTYILLVSYFEILFNFQVFNVSRRRSRAVLNELSGRYIQNKKGRSKVWEKVNFITIKNNS